MHCHWIKSVTCQEGGRSDARISQKRVAGLEAVGMGSNCTEVYAYIHIYIQIHNIHTYRQTDMYMVLFYVYHFETYEEEKMFAAPLVLHFLLKLHIHIHVQIYM